LSDREIFAKNRLILCHFDSYSAALVFARFGKTLLSPGALPLGAGASSAPPNVGELNAGDTVLQAVVARYGLNPVEVSRDGRYDAWLTAEDADPIRIHLLRFQTFLAPCDMIQSHGGVFCPISALRGAPAVELGLIRRAFDLIVGGEQTGA